MAVRLATGPYADLAGQPAAVFRPPPFLSWLPAMPPLAVLVGLQVLGTAAAVAVLATAAARRQAGTLPVAWCCLLVLAGLRGSLGKVLHNDVLLLLASVPVVLAPAGARLGDGRRSGRWGWPVRAALVVVGLVYFCCGVQKLRYTGVSWVAGDNLRWVLWSAAASDRAPTVALARYIADHAWLAHAAAGALLAFELTAPVLLARVKTIPIFVGGAVALHGATWLTLGLDYWAWSLTVAAVALPFLPRFAARSAWRSPTPRG